MDVEDSKLEREKGALVQALVSRNRPLVLAILSEHALEAQVGGKHVHDMHVSIFVFMCVVVTGGIV
jgi:hypothetical protein